MKPLSFNSIDSVDDKNIVVVSPVQKQSKVES